jgi:hypothetical protein
MCQACSYCSLRWGSRAAYCRAHRLPYPLRRRHTAKRASCHPLRRWRSTRHRAPGSQLGTFLKSFQRSQQLVWWKLPSSTCILREVHPVNILTPPHSTLAVCWITAQQPIIFFLCLSKSVASSGFVNMSAICSPVATWYMLTIPFLTSSLKWCYLMLRCFVLGLILGTFAILIAPSLSSKTLQWTLHGFALTLIPFF